MSVNAFKGGVNFWFKGGFAKNFICNYNILMALFLSTHSNKMDKKYRVSIPSQFRNILANNSVVVYKSIINNCIECCSIERLESIYAMIEKLDPLSEEYDYLTTAILGGSTQLLFDKEEGRVVMPKNLIENVQIDENVVFVGKGHTFEMWNPDLFDEYFKKSREVSLKNRNVLKFAS